MLVKEKMTPNPITITRQATIAQALEIMRQNKIRRLPVMDKDSLVGIVTDRDLSEVSPSRATSLSIFELNYLLSKTKIGDILSPKQKLITISPDAFLEEAALLMRNHKIGGIPVVENGKLVGIITETNIFDAFIEIMGLRQEGFRLTVKLVEDKPGVLAEVVSAIASCGGNITHISTYPAGGHALIVFRINRGSAQDIQEALGKLGYEVYVHQQNNVQ
ncbi:MAG: CBS domain-containing protein [Peptococcaceae bacterium]|jgi:acetoin utilization protein AcuB|nr:CBS domain-containing protein [Peptococcaceae bacterium]MDH7523968.1 CBS domain-containing protein [Peptococcaceae bacterium]